MFRHIHVPLQNDTQSYALSHLAYILTSGLPLRSLLNFSFFNLCMWWIQDSLAEPHSHSSEGSLDRMSETQTLTPTFLHESLLL